MDFIFFIISIITIIIVCGFVVRNKKQSDRYYKKADREGIGWLKLIAQVIFVIVIIVYSYFILDFIAGQLITLILLIFNILVDIVILILGLGIILFLILLARWWISKSGKYS